jgi:hypothetical protein
MTVPQPGDLAACSAGGAAGKIVHALQLAAGGGKYAEYEHVFVYLGDGMVLQAEPGGSRIVPMTVHAKTIWSTGIINIPDEARARVPVVARALEHVPYSYLDYASVGAHRLHIPAPHLRAYIRDVGHMQCAQLADEFMRRLGVHLYADGRWPGDVIPCDIARLLAETAHG